MRRNFGLDVARAAAISAVLVSHGVVFFAATWTYPSPSLWSGFLGVELFFVLSGFLIGQILIAEVVPTPTWPVLGRFWVRRWLRTLPAYFAMLAFLAWLGRPIPWSMLFFLQNFDTAELAIFPASWSLAVEEWFYVALPLLLMAVARRWPGSSRAFLRVCATVVIVSLAARVVYVFWADPSWDEGVRKQIPLRMDSLVIGVLLAGVRAHAPDTYARATAMPGALVLVSLAMFAALTAYWELALGGGAHVDRSFFARTVLFDVVSIACGALVVGLERWWPSASGGAATGVVLLSTISYSVYLVHTYTFYVVFDYTRTAWPLAALPAFLALTGAASSALYLAIERPFMALRTWLTVTRHDRERAPHA
jgi:peptidoglycan/LPS O-acetylase OafA/YrhL